MSFASRSPLLRSLVGFVVVSVAAATSGAAESITTTGCPTACVSGCNLDQAAACRNGGAGCISLGCAATTFDCFGITLFEVKCGDAT